MQRTIILVFNSEDQMAMAIIERTTVVTITGCNFNTHVESSTLQS